MPVLGEIFGDAFRKKNVSGIPAIHHALGDVDAGAGDVRSVVHIGHSADRSAVDPHPHFKIGEIL